MCATLIAHVREVYTLPVILIPATNLVVKRYPPGLPNLLAGSERFNNWFQKWKDRMYTILQKNLRNYCAQIEHKLLVMITVMMWSAAGLIAGLVYLETYQMVMAL